MKIAIGSDHAGFDLKQVLVQRLKQEGHQVEDVGAYNTESSDYPVFGEKVAQAVASKAADRGIVICGNGIGMSIVANKFPGVRAALVFTEKMAEQTRSHNDSNVLSLAGRDLPLETNLKLADIWLKTPFSQVDRHVRRVEEIAEVEKMNLKS
ncbi:MAG TPA: ribose 5-phosphate isomerase B [bacterium]|jgi:ribose 5-phosphate isomerase B|nr:ribose 5-phosphate isomerase B [bacterium]